MSVALRVEGLSFTYAGRSKPTLKEITLAIEPGSLVLLAGRSGSGKSTLLRAMAGLIPRHSAGAMQGRVVFCAPDSVDLDTRHATPGQLAGRVGLVLQSADEQLCATSITGEIAFGLENLALPPDEIGARVDAAIERFGLAGCVMLSSRQLSGGQKQRLLLAAIWAMHPSVLLLDEPLSQLDPVAAHELLEELSRLRTQGLAIVVAEHRLDDLLKIADRLLALDCGRLVADAPLSDMRAIATGLQASGLQTQELKCRTPDSRQLAAGPPLLNVERLRFQFPRSPRPLFEELMFKIHPGERVALVGPNGGGKSTLLAVIAGLLKHSSGKLQMPVATDRSTACGLLPQNADLALFCDSVYDELAFGPRQLGRPTDNVHEEVLRVADQLNIADFLDQPPFSLSQGQRLRVALAATLTLRPRLLLLDEPTTGQDVPEVNHLLAAVTKGIVEPGDCANKALIFSTHDLHSVVRFADRVLVLAGGRILADGPPYELMADDALLAAARLRRPADIARFT